MRYRLSPAAMADIDGIYDYTAEHWGVERAEAYVAAIRTACDSIGGDGRPGRSLADVRSGYWKLTSGSHFIVFRLRTGYVDVTRILHRRMDIVRHLAN